MLPPLGLYFLSMCTLHATKTHYVAAKARVSSRTMEDVATDNGGCDGERWRAWKRTMGDMTADDRGCDY